MHRCAGVHRNKCLLWITLALSTFLCTSYKWCFSIQNHYPGASERAYYSWPLQTNSWQKGRGEILPPSPFSAPVSIGRGKGKRDPHRTISDCPSWQSRLECLVKQAFSLTSPIYRLYHIGLYNYLMHSPSSRHLFVKQNLLNWKKINLRSISFKDLKDGAVKNILMI